MSVVAFTGLLRFIDMVRIHRSDSRFQFDHLCINNRASKTDPHQKGQEVFVSRFPGQFYAVKTIWDYLWHANALKFIPIFYICAKWLFVEEKLNFSCFRKFI